MSNQFCPFVDEPLEECLCYAPTSRNVKEAIYFCSKHFDECSIYQKYVDRQSIELQEKIP